MVRFTIAVYSSHLWLPKLGHSISSDTHHDGIVTQVGYKGEWTQNLLIQTISLEIASNEMVAEDV